MADTPSPQTFPEGGPPVSAEAEAHEAQKEHWIAQGLPPITPDTIEQDYPDEMDNIIPSHGYQMLPLVGLGGSAGSIPALQQFFRELPSECGMAFVVILHLAPEHGSILDTILGNSTKMTVVSAQDGQKVQANTVYVIPPGKILTATNGHLKLTDLEPERGRRVAVDLFFRSLADTHGPHAAAIILSGADGDGALGIRRVKERGGLTIAQDPQQAEHDSMPRTAIATGMVDWVLPVELMPARLVEYQENETRLRLPPEEGPQPAKAPRTTPDDHENALRDVVAHLRTRTGRDFSYYKRATVVRRISRRMQVNGTPTMPEYLGFLRTHPGEAGALQQDLLISVTNFFRDRDAFATLESALPSLFEGKGTGDAVRVWTVACATGEEAYSVAMLLLERASQLDAPPVVQVFATDLAEEVITSAREGFYPLSISADVSEERLRRFFIKEHGGYRARRELRESVLFAVHDVLKDAPFSRVELITCRNLLIYLTREAQTRAFEIFHFALRAKGLLFLGTSESTDDDDQLFTPLNKKHRLYRQQHTAPRISLPVPLGFSTVERAAAMREHPTGGSFVHGAMFNRGAEAVPRPAAEQAAGHQISWEELHLKLLERFAAPSLVVTREYDLVHVSANASRFLHFNAGHPTLNLLQMVHPMLRAELRAILFRAVQSNTTVEAHRVPVDLEGQTVAVDLQVAPAPELAPEYLLVTFELREASAGDAPRAVVESEPALRQMERELDLMKRRLRETVEQYEAGVEELKAGNEELQAMNEELRSSGEELETSREELQSINEELSTVNHELKGKVDELAHANSDLANFMAATGVATIFLDRQLLITRYTPTAVELFRLLPGDLGRPLTDLTHQLAYPELRADAERVLSTLIPLKREVSNGPRWFLAQLLPYRTGDDRIAGVVLSFVDISETRQAREALVESEARLQRAIQIQTVGVIFFTVDGRITGANDAFLRMSGFSREAFQAGAIRWDQLTPPEFMPVSKQAMAEFAAQGRTSPYTKQYLRKDGTRWWALLAATRVSEDEGVEFVIDLTEQKRTEEALRESETQLRLTIEAGQIGTCDWNYQAGEMYGNERRFRMFGMESTTEALPVETFIARIHPEDQERVRRQLAASVEQRGEHNEEYRTVRPDGTICWIIEQGRVVEWQGSKPWRVSSVLFDVTARREAEAALRAREEQLRLVSANTHDYAIFSMGLDRRITSWNSGATAVLGYTEEEVLGQLGDLVFTPEERAAGVPEAEAQLALREGRAADERWHVRRDGARFWGNGAMMAMHDVGGEAIGLVKIFRNETAQLQAKEALEKSRAELWAALQETERARGEAEAAGLAKDHFMAVLSHELRTPLTPVLMAVRTLSRMPDLPPRVRSSLEMIQRNVELEAHFIDDLLDLTRITRGKLELQCAPLDVHQAVRQALEITMPEFEAKQQRVTTELAAPGHTLVGDAIRLQQVFWNLLKNASKFTPRGGQIFIRSRVAPAEPGAPARLLVEVTDTGIGFDAEAGAKIFGAFTQASQDITREFGGLGLGLAISKAAIDAHGGAIHAQSPGRGQGATFTVELPLSA